MTKIETAFGEFPAQTLRKGDRVRTRKGTFADIRWIDRVVLNEDFLQHHPEAQPVAIPANALGRGLPKQEVILSPGQHILVEGGFGPPREMTAIELLEGGKAIRKPETMITYTFFLCAMPVIVRCSGLWVRVVPPAK